MTSQEAECIFNLLDSTNFLFTNTLLIFSCTFFSFFLFLFHISQIFKQNLSLSAKLRSISLPNNLPKSVFTHLLITGSAFYLPRACSDRTRASNFKLKEGRFRLDIRRKSFVGARCPEKLWMSHPWTCSRLGWVFLWVTWPSESCFCLSIYLFFCLSVIYLSTSLSTGLFSVLMCYMCCWQNAEN